MIKKIILVLLLIFCASICNAETRVCINKSTGKLIEAQSGGSTQAHLDTLKQNALNAGYKESEIEVKWIKDEDLPKLIEQSRTQAEIDEAAIKEEMQKILRQQAIDNLRAAGTIR